MAFNWKEFFLGKPGGYQQYSNFGQDQQDALSQLLQQALSGMQNPTAGFDPIAQNAMNDFESQGIPSIAERFTSMGAGSQGSSAFTGALGNARAGLDSQLAALRSQYGLQNQSQLQGLAQLGLTPKFQTDYHESQPGFLQSVAGPALQAILAGVTGGVGTGLGLAALNKIMPQQNQTGRSQTSRTPFEMPKLSTNRLGGAFNLGQQAYGGMF
jgi:hypothetical protein